MTDPPSELPPVPPFSSRLPRALAKRIRVTARRPPGRPTPSVPLICIFGAGAHFDDRPWADRPPH
ncbi:hypothetical protein [Blastococcus sp. PRF04-17]|uniref:hypothetical protein n=1 Tax=Blastococcus sp. PRF04-17 TaxID=2933797 RepID=UPI001FF52018|nr:hypothetical protein [Blastococcus sp. PRF04-17]UOY01113.1 hypothetical protein MVA48_19475 [Blastococcus sp. PRF04-17]